MGDLVWEASWGRRAGICGAGAVSEAAPDFVCCYNTHPLNAMVSRLASEARPDGVRAIFLHEPAKPGHAAYGWRQRALFGAVAWMQRRALRYASDVIVPSQVARERLEAGGIRFSGRVHECRLLLEDIEVTEAGPRRYFSMVGRFNATKPLDAFIRVINESARRGFGYEFQIVTASEIGRWVGELTPDGRARTRIVNPAVLSDEAIARALKESVAVLCLHANVTQSGVIPMALMQGTPVMVRDEAGLTQHVLEGETGKVVGGELEPEELLAAMAAVEGNQPAMSAAARRVYEAEFDAGCWAGQYGWLIDLLG